MGKLLCDSSAGVGETLQATASPVAALPWLDSMSTPLPPPAMEALDLVDSSGWETVLGLEEQQRRNLQRLYAKGVLWKYQPRGGEDDENCLPARSVVFRLSHGGDVSADGNCLFTASEKAMASTAEREIDARELRRRTVRRFLEDLGSAASPEVEAIGCAIRHMYAPDLGSGWGIHVVQEVKLLAKKEDRVALDSAIDELVLFGMQRELAAESIYKERCLAVDDGPSWAKYMSVSGSVDDEFDIVTLQYTEDGLLSVEENRLGQAAAFGDDIAIECLATEFKREIYVVQAHGSDAMVDEENCVFFLPHRPRSRICEVPFFLFMKGTGWCGAGGDHYEPLIARACPHVSSEKVGMVL